MNFLIFCRIWAVLSGKQLPYERDQKRKKKERWGFKGELRGGRRNQAECKSRVVAMRYRCPPQISRTLPAVNGRSDEFTFETFWRAHSTHSWEELRKSIECPSLRLRAIYVGSWMPLRCRTGDLHTCGYLVSQSWKRLRKSKAEEKPSERQCGGGKRWRILQRPEQSPGLRQERQTCAWDLRGTVRPWRWRRIHCDYDQRDLAGPTIQEHPMIKSEILGNSPQKSGNSPLLLLDDITHTHSFL